MENTSDISIDIAWLHYVGGLTQAEIANQRGYSKATVHRLLRAAHDSGAVRVFISERPDSVLGLEQEVISAFGLKNCSLVPPTLSEPSAILEGVASLAVQSLLKRLEANKSAVVGLGAGRTLAAMARLFPRISFPGVEFVSLTGDFSVFRIGHYTDVLKRLADCTGGTGYSIAAPIVADSESDRKILVAQKGTQIAFQKINEAEFSFIGIGGIKNDSFFTAFNLVPQHELLALRDHGVVADFCGNLLDKNGKLVDCDLARRMVACQLNDLESIDNTVVAYGSDKVEAILAGLKTGLVSELISDAATARIILDSDV